MFYRRKRFAQRSEPARAVAQNTEPSDDFAGAEPVDRDGFLFVEYSEASNAYLKGVDVGFATLRNFILLNAALLAVIGASANPNSEYFELFEKANAFLPYIGLVASLLLWSSLKYYDLHLENCRSRCEEIEKIYGGALFTRNGKITRKGTLFFKPLSGLSFILLAFLIFWIYMLLRNSIDLRPVFDFIAALISSN